MREEYKLSEKKFKGTVNTDPGNPIYREDDKRDYILGHFSQALDERWIEVYYQPIMRAMTGLICNEEALARWVDPVKGMILPEEFIPVIEDAKLLHKLDLYMIDLVLSDIRKYQDGKIVQVVPISVNVSKYDFEYCDMVSEILKRVEAAGVSPKYLVIEIAESVLELEHDFIKEQLNKLQSRGFKIWMDDFGRGYGSLNVLQDFDFDLIKLDMKFMKDFSKKVKTAGIIRKIVEMAEQLGVDTLAEGVETEEQLEFLREIGCDKVQGFLYSKPNPLNEILKRSDMGIGLYRENIEESEFYDQVGQASLTDMELNGDAGMLVAETFAGIGIGILEFDGVETYRLMRANAVYKEYLETIYGRNIKVSDVITYTDKDRKRVFEESVRRCLKSGNWETAYDIVSTDKVKFNTNIRLFSRDKVTGNYAILIVMVSEKRVEGEGSDRFSDTLKEDTSLNPPSFENVVPPVEDIDLQSEKAALERNNVLDSAIIRIAKLLNTFEDYNETMNRVLEELGSVISPDRICIFERVGDKINNPFELCRKGIISQKEYTQDLEYNKYFKLWADLSVDGRAVNLDSISRIRVSYRDVYCQLKLMGVKRIIVVPVFSKDEVIGFISAENYRLDESDDTEFLLSSVAVFLSYKIANSTLVHRLVYMADNDALTSAHNRYAMIKKEEELAAGEGCVGVGFIDINGLKEINDNLGHDEGDLLIIRASKLIAKHFGMEHLYRVGGDEFVVLAPDMEKYVFERKQYQFRQELEDNDKVSMASGFVWIPDRRKVSEAIKTADRLMYEDKAKFYVAHDRRRSQKEYV